jgi:hypothetical protein
LRTQLCLIVPAALCVAWLATPAFAASGPAISAAAKKPAAAKRVARKPLRKRGSPYGFLPGYRPPEVIEHERRMYGPRGPYYALPVARFYRGRWNGGGFGPCYTYTPIGPIWNCGR